MHDHAPGIRATGNRRLLAISLAITAVVMTVQIVGAALSGSLALLADAAHMFTDAAALVIALIASPRTTGAHSDSSGPRCSGLR
jgi:cobalt-zinc-cadmium efflux system protein